VVVIQKQSVLHAMGFFSYQKICKELFKCRETNKKTGAIQKW